MTSMTRNFHAYRERLTPQHDDASVCDRVQLLAEILTLAAKIDDEFWSVMSGDRTERQAPLEAAMTQRGNEYSVDPKDIAKRLAAYADAWMDEIEQKDAA